MLQEAGAACYGYQTSLWMRPRGSSSRAWDAGSLAEWPRTSSASSSIWLGKPRRSLRNAMVETPSFSEGRRRTCSQQLPRPKLKAMRCMFSRATELSSMQVSDFVVSLRTAIAAVAVSSIAGPPLRQPIRPWIWSGSWIVMKCQGRMPLPVGANMPASTICLISSSLTGSPVNWRTLLRARKVSMRLMVDPFRWGVARCRVLYSAICRAAHCLAG